MQKRRIMAVLLSMILLVSNLVPAYGSEPKGNGSGTVTEEFTVGEESTYPEGVMILTTDSNAPEEGEDNGTPAGDAETVKPGNGNNTPDVTVSENEKEERTVSEDTVVIKDSKDPMTALGATLGVHTKPAFLGRNEAGEPLFGMVKGQKWLAGKGAVTSNKKVLKVDAKGYVTAKKAGSAEISTEGVNYKITVASPALSDKKVVLNVGENKNVSLNGIEGYPVSWITENANVAQVASGTIYATGKGKTKVTAFVGGKAHIFKVQVNDKAGTTYLMNTRVKKAQKIMVPKANKASWTSSSNNAPINSTSENGVSGNEAINYADTTPITATAEKGKVTSDGVGNCLMNGSDGHGLKVYGNSPELRTDTGLAAAGKSNQYTLKMKVGERFLLDFPNSHELPKWRSSKPQVAAANEFGLLTAESEGTTKLTAKAAGQKVTVNVTVGAESTVIPGHEIIMKQLVDSINGNKTVYIIYDPVSGEYREVRYDDTDTKKPDDGNEPGNGDDNGDTPDVPDVPDGNVYDVLFDSNGGTNVAPQKVAEGGKVVKPAEPIRNNFVFDGWLKEGFLYSFIDAVKQDMTLVADWYDPDDVASRKQLVVFDANGGMFDNGEEFLVKKLPKNSLMNVSSVLPVWDGYSFLGWFYFDGTAVYNTDTVTEDVVIYAHWRNLATGEVISTAKPVVVFNDGHGGVIMRRVGANGTVEVPEVSWAGHRFDYWLYPDGSAYLDGDTFDRPTVLTAHWTDTDANADGSYNIVYNLCGGVNDPANPYTYTENDEFDIKNPTKEGSKFKGWLVYIAGIRQGDGTDTSVKVFKGTKGHIILVANWESGRYSLSFNSTGGNTIATKALSFGEEFGTLPTPQKLGHNFGGWFYSTGENAREATETDLMPATNLTLYAAWTENEFMSYSITYNLNDEGGKSRATHSRPKRDYTKNSDGFWLVNPERVGYEFLGWTGTDLGAEPVADVYVPRGSSGNRTYDAHWGDYVNPVFTITYDLDDADSEIKAEYTNYKVDYTKNSDGFYLTNPTRWGYDFAGWVGINGTVVENEPNKSVFIPRGSTGNREYRAQWEPSPYGPGQYIDHPYSTLTLNLGELDGAEVDGVTYVLSDATTGSGTLSNNGVIRMLTGTSVMLFAPTNGDNAYYNDFWSSVDTDPSSGEGRIFVFEITKDTVVSLSCEKNMQYFTYDLDYDLAGGWFNKSVPKSTYTIKTPTFTIGAPTRTGYTFLGWTGTGIDGTVMSIRIPQGSTGSRSYAANWSGANTYDLNFNANGGTCSMQKKTVEFGSAYGTLPTPTWTNYDFKGWWTAAVGGDQVDDQTVMETEGATVYAHWDAKKYTLTYNANGGSVSPTSKQIAYGQQYGTLPTPTRNYCSFQGWWTAASGGTQVSSATTMTGSTTIYAHWLGQAVTVTFNANGGTVGTTSKTVNYAASYGDLPTPVYNHHDFAGWYTAASGGTKVTSSTQVSSTTNHNLYAHWTNTTYKITYNGNGGTSSTPQESYTYGATIKLNTKPNVWKAGMEFDSWNTAANGSGTKYVPGQSVTLTRESFTLYAQWKNATAFLTVNGTHALTKVRVYDKFGNYHDYTSYSNIPVYPGYDVALLHASTSKWCAWYDSTSVAKLNHVYAWQNCRDFGVGEAYTFTVPSDASGSATLGVYDGDYAETRPTFNMNYGFIDTGNASGWASSDTLISGVEFGGKVNSYNVSAIDKVKVYDSHGYCHTYSDETFDSNHRQQWQKYMRVYPGCKVVFYLASYVTGYQQWESHLMYDTGNYLIGNGGACKFIVPSSASGGSHFVILNGATGNGAIIKFTYDGTTSGWACNLSKDAFEIGE